MFIVLILHFARSSGGGGDVIIQNGLYERRSKEGGRGKGSEKFSLFSFLLLEKVALTVYHNLWSEDLIQVLTHSLIHS